MGSAVSRKIAHLANELPISIAYETVIKNKEAGAVAAMDCVPFSYISANFTFNTDNCVRELIITTIQCSVSSLCFLLEKY